MDRDTFVNKAKTQLARWSVDLAGLRAELELEDGPNRAKLQKQIDKFTAERQAADALLDRIAKSNDASWTRMSETVQKAWQRLERSFDLVGN